MFAIVATSGKQYRVEPGAQITIDHIDAEVGSEITLEDVLLRGLLDLTLVDEPEVDDVDGDLRVKAAPESRPNGL